MQTSQSANAGGKYYRAWFRTFVVPKPRDDDFLNPYYCDWLADLWEKKKFAGLTVRGRTDGGGAQLLAQISTLAFCRAEGIPFFYSKSELIAHGEGSDWIERWEAFCDLKTGHELSGQRVVSAPKFFPIRGRPPASTVVSISHCHVYCDAHPGAYLAIQNEIRARCLMLEQAPRKGVLAVHVRRGDVVNNPEYSSRITDLTTVAKFIRALKAKRPDLHVQIHSEGSAADFSELPEYCELVLDGDVFQTLSALANAEILIMAKSAFSYVAGLLSRGTVYYQPFWHPSLPTWHPAENLL